MVVELLLSKHESCANEANSCIILVLLLPKYLTRIGATRIGLPWFLFGVDGTVVLEQSTQVHFAFEVGLGTGGDGGEKVRIGIPHGDAAMVLAAVLIVNDKWDDLVPEAFLQHDQSSHAAVAVFKGMNAFEPDMEVQNVSQLHFFLGLIFLN